MENYKEASKVGQELTMSYLRKRMKEMKVRNKDLVLILEVSESTLIGYFKLKTPMPLGIYFEICGVLDLRPYLIPEEDDNTGMKRMFFN